MATRRLGDASSFSKDENVFEQAKTSASPSRRADAKPAALRGQTGALEAAAHCASRVDDHSGGPAGERQDERRAGLGGPRGADIAARRADRRDGHLRAARLVRAEGTRLRRDRAALEASVTETLRVVAATASPTDTLIRKRKTLLDVLERAWSRWSAYRSVVDAAETRAVPRRRTSPRRSRRRARRWTPSPRRAPRRARRLGTAATPCRRRRINERKRGNGGHRGSAEGVDSVVESIRRAARAVGPRGVGRRRAERRPVRVGGRRSCSRRRRTASGCSSKTPTCARRRCADRRRTRSWKPAGSLRFLECVARPRTASRGVVRAHPEPPASRRSTRGGGR